MIQRLVSAANGILEHANIRLWAPLDRVASLVWVTPNVHKIHHSRQRAETNSNYGNVLTIYDRLLGTFTPSDRLSRSPMVWTRLIRRESRRFEDSCRCRFNPTIKAP